MQNRAQSLKQDCENEDRHMSDVSSSSGDEEFPRTDSEMEDENIESDTNSEDQEESSSQEERDTGSSLATVSFGALAKAQRNLSISSTPEHRKAGRVNTKQGPCEKAKDKKQTPKRTSKNAPAEMSSKRPVSRKREAVPVPCQTAQDPRFNPAIGHVNEEKFRRNYSFLREYQANEIKTLKEEIKGIKDEVLREQTKSKIKSMESKWRADEAKERSAELLSEYKRKEKELIKKGKKPYFLSRFEQKKIILMDKYSKLDEKQLDRVLEKKRKRQAAKQRKNMPSTRRNVSC